MNDRKTFIAVVVGAAALAVLAGFVIDAAKERWSCSQSCSQSAPISEASDEIIVPAVLLTEAQYEPPKIEAPPLPKVQRVAAGCPCESGGECNCQLVRRLTGRVSQSESYAKQLEDEVAGLKDEVGRVRQRAKADIREWENWYRGLKEWLSTKGLRISDRKSPAGKFGGAINDGMYGEGRPQTGANGQSVPYGGRVEVDCPECRRE